MKNESQAKKYCLDEKRIRRVRTILGAAIDVALNLVVFRKEILKSLKKAVGKVGVFLPFSREIYYNEAPDIY